MQCVHAVSEVFLVPVRVHIADPTRWVTFGSELEKEARRRVTSMYLPTGTFTPTLATN